MSAGRQIVHRLICSASTAIGAEEVHISDETINHIQEFHPLEFARFDEVIGTVEKPTHVYTSDRKPDSFVLVNRTFTSSVGGDPMRVAVKVRDGVGFVDTAHYASSTGGGLLIWEDTDAE